MAKAIAPTLLTRPLVLAAGLLGRAIGRLAELLGRRQLLPVEVLIADPHRRRPIERELRAALRGLQRAVGSPHMIQIAVVVQQVIRTDRELAGCYQTGWRPDGVRYALLRLALQVNGRHLDTEELLAVLAEQYIGLTLEQSLGSSVLVPVELEAPEIRPTGRITPFRPNPLTPSNSATNPGAQ